MTIMSKQWFGVTREQGLSWGSTMEMRRYALSKEQRKRLEEAAEDVRHRMQFDKANHVTTGWGIGRLPLYSMDRWARPVKSALGQSMTHEARIGALRRHTDIPHDAWRFGEAYLAIVTQIEDLINQQVPAQIRTQINDAFQPMRARADAAKAALNTVLPRPAGQWGYLELPRLAVYDYYAKVGLYFPHQTKQFIWDMLRLSRVSTPWMAGRAPVFLPSRPRIRFDDSGRIHSEIGPAIDFDVPGGQFWAWRGMIVPQGWFTGRLTAKRALGYRNAEKRRAACDKLGWHKVLNDLGAQVLDRHPDPKIGTLVQVQIDGMPERFLQVQCGTGRQFALPVPRDMSSAWQANAWTYGINSTWAFRAPEVRS